MNIILKCDDFWGKEWPKEKDFFDLVLKHKIKISLGIVGYGLETAGSEVVNYLKNNIDLIQPFNHSYWHCVASPLKEFYLSSREYQKKSILNNQTVVLKKLGYEMTTIGFPTNACDNTTLDVLKNDFPKLQNIYYTAIAHNREEMEKLGRKIINVNTTEVFQIHPFTDFFSLSSFEQLILDQLKQGNKFVFPNEI